MESLRANIHYSLCHADSTTYGASCYQKNKEHKEKFWHPPSQASQPDEDVEQKPKK